MTIELRKVNGYNGFGAVFDHLQQLVIADSLVSVFLPHLFLEATLHMAFSMSRSIHVYVIIRLKMSDNVDGLASNLFCHYGETLVTRELLKIPILALDLFKS